MDDTDYYDDFGNKICDRNGNNILDNIDIESNNVNIKKKDYIQNEENLIFLDNLQYVFRYFLIFGGWLYDFLTKYE